MTGPPCFNSTAADPLPWHLAAGLLHAGPVRLGLQRIGLSHWQPEALLRSWGLAPLWADAEGLHTPCFDDEALWLGAWLEPDDCAATLTLFEAPDAPGASAGTMVLPSEGQLTALAGPGRAPQPITRGGQAQRRLVLTLACGGRCVHVPLLLHHPDHWPALTGQPAPPPRTAPPPRPPRLG